MKNELKSTRYVKYLLYAHLVFTPKYKKRIFTKEHLELMREVFEFICKENDSELVEFDGESDHVHLLVLYPPRIALSVLVNSLKGVSSRRLRQKFTIFKKEYWGSNALWSRSYFVASVGGTHIEYILKKYIEQQKIDSKT